MTKWFVDPFARATDIGELSAFTLTKAPTIFAWTDDGYKTPELNDLTVYELHIEQFNDTFDGVIDRLDYLQTLGVNCLELMPVMSHKLDFDWGYGPLHYFSPSAHFGGADGLKRPVNTCHGLGVAVILDVVYQHVDPSFPYNLVYQDVAQTGGAPAVASPMIGAMGPFGPQCDFSKTFTQDYFQASNQLWVTDYHVDGFRYDEVTDYYFSPTDTAYANSPTTLTGSRSGSIASARRAVATAASFNVPRRCLAPVMYWQTRTPMPPGKTTCSINRRA